MVLWKVSLSRFPWTKKIRPRNCSRGPIRTARGTSVRAAISIYVIVAIAPVKLRERFAGLGVPFADAIGRPRSSFTSLKTGLIFAISARCLTTRSPGPIRHAIRRNNLY